VDAKVFSYDDYVSRRACQPCRDPSAMRIERAKLAIPRLSDYQKAAKAEYDDCFRTFFESTNAA
tara:strand:+ start:257 stop:448 length:192 start_codon:yes stop_codon:yes gene_type:complete